MLKVFGICLLFSCVSASVYAQEPGITLAVSDLVAQGVKNNEAAVISEQLRTELLKDNRIRMIERAQMEAILKEKGLAQAGVATDDDALAMGKILGVGHIIVGSIGTAGSYTLLSVRVLDVNNGMVITSDAIKTKGGINQILDEGVSQAARNISAKLFNKDTRNTADTGIKEKSKGKSGKLLAIGGVGALVVGGGVAAVLLLNNDNKSGENTPAPNVEITIP